MHRISIKIISLAAILISTCFTSNLFSQDTEIKTFWNKFRKAVEKNDTATVASLTFFTKRNGLIGKNRHEFYAKYNSLFDKKTIEIMGKTNDLNLTEEKEYIFSGSGAQKFFAFKKIEGNFMLVRIWYYD